LIHDIVDIVAVIDEIDFDSEVDSEVDRLMD